MTDGHDDTGDRVDLGDRMPTLTHAFKSLRLMGVNFDKTINTSNDVPSNNSLSDDSNLDASNNLSMLLYGIQLLNPEFYTSDSLKTLSDIQSLLKQASIDLAAINSATTDPLESIESRKQKLVEDIGKIQERFEELASAAHFKGSEKQQNLPTPALRRETLGEGIKSEDLGRFISRLSKVQSKIGRGLSSSPRRPRR